jgi:hypothetical protein
VNKGRCKQLYKKYENLSNPILIREAIDKELKDIETNRNNSLIENYPKFKSELIGKRINLESLIADIEYRDKVRKELFGDYICMMDLNLGNLKILRDELYKINEQIRWLDMDYNWVKFMMTTN